MSTGAAQTASDRESERVLFVVARPAPDYNSGDALDTSRILGLSKTSSRWWIHTEHTSDTENRKSEDSVLFYIVETNDGYVVWEAAPEEMFNHMKADPTLNTRLDRNPFITRAEAERRCKELMAAKPRKRPSP